MERWFLYSRNSIAPAIRRLNAEVIVTDAHKQSTDSSCSLYGSSATRTDSLTIAAVGSIGMRE